jgi:hypothetical protein
VHRATRAAQVTFHFTGRAVGLLALRREDAGYAQVFADGRLVTTLDLRGRTAGPRVVWASRWASVGRHVLVVRALGTRGRPVVAIDGFAVGR